MQKEDEVLLLKIETEQINRDLTTDELNILGQKCVRKSMVLYLTSKSEKNVTILWKCKNAEEFFIHVPLQKITEDDDKLLYEFIVKFLAFILKNGQSGKILKSELV